jgi:hypothetical protein
MKRLAYVVVWIFGGLLLAAYAFLAIVATLRAGF